MYEFRARRRIEFSDTDMAGICHFARFFIFMETAEHEFLASLGTPVSAVEDGHRTGWPRVAASCDYLAPARFGDVLDLHVKVARKGRTSISWEHEISRQGTPIARGRITTVHCRFGLDGAAQPIPIPPELAEKLEETP
jgi:YbgC/YbaW family acyl-CoA thioester hydrolase